MGRSGYKTDRLSWYTSTNAETLHSTVPGPVRAQCWMEKNYIFLSWYLTAVLTPSEHDIVIQPQRTLGGTLGRLRQTCVVRSKLLILEFLIIIKLPFYNTRTI